MTKENWEDIEIDKVIGMDIEPSDTEVGIMSAGYCVILQKEDGKKLQLYFNEDNIIDLVRILKPVINDIKFQEEEDKFYKGEQEKK